MDGAVRVAQARTLGRGAQMVGTGEEKWEVSQLLFCRWHGVGCGQQEEAGKVGGGVW